jgi:hypothetical protein
MMATSNNLLHRSILALGMAMLCLSLQPSLGQASNPTRFLSTTEWGYQEVEDPAGAGQREKVQRFEVRPGDCAIERISNDCKRELERSEIVAGPVPERALAQEQWYLWQVFFPEDYTNVYPARSIHGQFLNHRAEPVWTFEVGSTGVLWLGNRVEQEPNYISLIDEDLLLGRWHEISVNVEWSKDEGFFRVWVNGQQRVDHRGPTCSNCKVFFSYGIMRSELSRFRSQLKTEKLPVQVVYFTQAVKSASGIGFPGYVPPAPKEQPADTASDNETIKPTVTVETNVLPATDPLAVEKDRGEGDDERL